MDPFSNDDFSKSNINSLVFEQDKDHLFRIIENGRYLLEKAFPEEIYQKYSEIFNDEQCQLNLPT